MEITARRLEATRNAKLSILRSGIIENLRFGTIKRAAEAAALLAEMEPTPMSLHLVKGRKLLIAIPVQTVQEAAGLFRAYIEARDLGASNAPGAELFVDSVKRGTISYNGRAWSSDGSEIV